MKNDKGFTLLEVLLVITLLGIILAITVPNIAKGSETANEELCNSTKLVIEAAIEQHDTIEKTRLGDKNDIVEYLHENQYLKHLVQCPKGGSYKYQNGKVICYMP